MRNGDLIGDVIQQRLGRATLPVQQVRGFVGTAFLFNELVESTPEFDWVREWLVTADALTQCEYAEVTLRPDLVTPAGAASEVLIMRNFKDLWTRDPGGAAAMRTVGLHRHGQKKGWGWDTQEVTHGWAATAENVRDIGPDPTEAYAFGHMTAARPGGHRALGLVRSKVARGRDDVIRWRGAVPEGFVGAPVIVVHEWDDDAFKLICLGLLLPGRRDNPIATFDTIRSLIDQQKPAAPDFGPHD